MIRTAVAACFSPLLVLACAAVGPEYALPEMGTRDAFSLQEARSVSAAELSAWWEVFDDPQLSKMVHGVLASNLDLGSAVESVVAARAAYGLVRADRLPNLSLEPSYLRSRQIGLPTLETVNQWSIGPAVSWEIDLFGRVRRSVESAKASLEAQAEDLRLVQVSLIAETVSTYLQLRSIQERLRIADLNVESQLKSQAITSQRFEAGMTAALDPAQAEVNVFTTRAAVPGLRLSLKNAVHRLSVLTGQEPTALARQLEPASPLPKLPEDLLVGVPADLLRNRPDVRAAERRLAAQTAAVGVAVAAQYPSINLSGAWNWLSSTAGGLFDGAALESGQVGPAVSVPIFNAGRLRSQVEAEEASMRQLELELRQQLLVAEEEVENALIAIVLDAKRVELLSGAAAAASRSAGLSRDLYAAGQSDFQNVLDAERSLFSLQDDEAIARLIVLTDVVDLYLALGGGWEPAAASGPERE